MSAGTAADLDLYLFDCSGNECVASRTDGDATDDESVMVQNPAVGKGKVEVDASRAGAGDWSATLVGTRVGVRPAGISDLLTCGGLLDSRTIAIQGNT